MIAYLKSMGIEVEIERPAIGNDLQTAIKCAEEYESLFTTIEYPEALRNSQDIPQEMYYE